LVTEPFRFAGKKRNISVKKYREGPLLVLVSDVTTRSKVQTVKKNVEGLQKNTINVDKHLRVSVKSRQLLFKIPLKTVMPLV